jgi:CheY-like chemotaxis protein
MNEHRRTRAHLLVVEDHFETRTYLRLALQGSYDVTTASTAEEALSLIEERPVDLLLLDIALGEGMTGSELMAHLRSVPAYTETPMIAMTAHHSHDRRDEVLDLGFDAYLSKPFFPDELLKLVARLLAHSPPDAEGQQPST